MKNSRFWAQAIAGLMLAFVVMCARGVFEKTKPAEILMAVGDGFTVVAFLYLGFGALMWVSFTGWFDIFSFAIKRGAHAIMPNVFAEEQGGYYEYKVKKAEKRKAFGEYVTLKLGAVFLSISVFLTALWYMVSE